MSCCNNGPITVKVYPNAPAVCPDTPDYTFTNANLTGEGVFFDHTGTAVQFYGIASSGGTIDVTLDAGNNTVNLELDADIVAGNFPDATTLVKGKAALATNAEALAKTSTVKVLTPSNLAAMGASTTFSGLTEYATQAETQAGVSTTLAVTPDGLKSVTSTILSTRSVANSAARGTATPAFTGQLLIQQDTATLYVALSTTIGDWFLAALPITGTADSEGLTINFPIGTLDFGASFATSTLPWKFEDDVEFDADVDFHSVGTISKDGSLLTADSVMTIGLAGKLNVSPRSDFISGANVTPSYDPLTYTTRRTLDSATATTAQISDVLCTLIVDLASALKPAIP